MKTSCEKMMIFYLLFTHGKGHIEDEIFETYRARTRRIIVTIGSVFDTFWEARQNEFIRSFRTWIDQIREGI
ncbi:MAG TPA: hypothetical protein QF480_09635 [Bacteroidales bacterium]|jgi:hypothetical protein|nr:hypothetical protein [Bacteroidales bacterium]